MHEHALKGISKKLAAFPNLTLAPHEAGGYAGREAAVNHQTASIAELCEAGGEGEGGSGED